MIGCNSASKQPPPTYVHVDSFTFINPQSASGAIANDRSHQITEVWAYYNGSAVGVFDLPVTFPVITSGNSGTLELSPGILVDGLNSFLSTYPFYTSDTFTLATQPGKIVNVSPVTKYYSGINDLTLYNFSGHAGYSYASGHLVIQPQDSDGIITLSVGDTLEDSCSRFVIPSGYAYVELDYKCNVPFYLGMAANESTYISSTAYYLAGIYPSDTWQKFYLSVADFAGQYKGTSYNLFIKAYLPPGVSNGTVYLRNIQLLSF